MKKIYICVCPRVIKCNCKLAHQVLNNIGVKNLAMIIKTVYCWCCFIDIKDCKKILITILCLKKNKELRVSKVSVCTSLQFSTFTKLNHPLLLSIRLSKDPRINITVITYNTGYDLITKENAI